MSAEERVIFDEVKAALATEQREHWNTQMRLSALQDEVAEERRLNNASLKPSQCVAAEDTQPTDTDLTRARARTKVLKRENAELTQIIETLELVEVALRTDVSRLEGYRVELESSAETQGRHMQQVDAACKAAEAKVIEQRKEIEALKSDEDLWICPSAECCTEARKCPHRVPHAYLSELGMCGTKCREAVNKCVKINPCKECATLREEILNRDAVILQYESRAEDREEIINALAKEIKYCAKVISWRLARVADNLGAATNRH